MPRLLERLLHDFILAARTLKREKAFSTTALLTFSLCIGANVVIFALVHAVLIKPLPYPEPDRLVTVYNAYPKANVSRSSVSVPHYLERKQGVAAFEEAAVYRGSSATVGEAGNPERIEAMSATPSFFKVLKANAAIGRSFSEEEGFYGKNNVVVLSHALWKQKYAADPAVMGRSMRINGTNHEIIGVLPPEFRFLNNRAQLWMPLCFSDDDRKTDRRHSNNQNMIARLRPGTTVTEAQQQVLALNQIGQKSDPFAKLVEDAGFTTHVKDLQADHVRELRGVLLLLQGGVLFLLLIGGVNLTNLLLVRTNARLKSLSVRQVLGASRLHIGLQLSAETVLISVFGGILGLLLGWVGLQALRLTLASQYRFLTHVSLDPLVILVCVLGSMLVGILLAIPVIWHGLAGNPASALSVESRGGTTTRAAHRLRHVLIVAQFALAFVLLAGAGVLGLSYARILAIKPGFRPDHVLSGSITMPWVKYKERDSRLALLDRMRTEIEAIPGVKSVAFTSILPFSNSFSNNATWVEGHDPKPGESIKAHFMGGLAGNYFETLGFSLIEGRFLTPDDCHTKVQNCVVDEAMARFYWPGQSAIGRRIYPQGPPDKDNKPFTIVGVVGTVKLSDLADKANEGAVFLPYSFSPSMNPSIVVRTEQEPGAIGTALRAAVLKADPEMPVFDLKTMEDLLSDSMDNRRLPLVLAMIFSGVALFLAAIGIYGVLAYAVEQRRREIGVRMALGALPSQIRTQFLGLAGRLVTAGVVLGVAGAWLSGRGMSSMLFGTNPLHPLVLGITAGLLALIAFAACLLPSMRAARVPPMEALRSE